MKYPWRFDVPKIGDKVFAVTIDDKDNRYINEVTIVDIQDNSYHVKVVDGKFTNEVEQSEDWENCSIGYWIEEFSFGHAMYFGETLFMTLKEAMDEVANSKEGD